MTVDKQRLTAQIEKGGSFRLLITTLAVGTVLLTTVVFFFITYQMGSKAIEREALRTVGAYAEGAHRALVDRLTFQHERVNILLSNAWDQCGKQPRGAVEGCLRRVSTQFMHIQRASAVYMELEGGKHTIRLGEGSEALQYDTGKPRGELATFPAGAHPKNFYLMQGEDPASRSRIVAAFAVKEIYPIFADFDYLGDAGESFLANRDGYFLTPAKYHVEAGVSHPIDARPMKTCLAKNTAEMAAPDYRDVDVIHGFRYIPEIGGGCIMVHIDHDEAMAGLGLFTYQWISAALILMLVFGGIAYLSSKRLAEYILDPLNALTSHFGNAGNGEMPKPAPPSGPAELVALAESLHRYTQNIEERERNTQIELQSRSRLMSDMSHELKTPITAILGLSRLMSGHPLTVEEARFVKLIHSAGEQLIALIDNSLDLAKLEAGKLTIARKEFDLCKNVEEVIAVMAAIAETRGYKVRLDCNMPVCGLGGTRFTGDPLRIRQILMNLLGNAIKFTAKGGVSLKISEMMEAATDTTRRFRFEVTDTGIGMTPEQAGNIFKRFGQGDESIARKHGGTGLGLVISKELVELMGGTIGVESKAGKGSTFWFELPLEVKHLID